MAAARSSVTVPGKLKWFAALTMASLALPACAPMPPANGGAQARAYDPCKDQSARQLGTAAGALLGGVLAKQMSHSKYAVPVGALLGAAIGEAIGKDVAKRQCDVYLVAMKHNLEFLSVSLKLPAASAAGGQEVVGLSATLVDRAGAASHFLPGSDQLTVAAKGYFAEIAASYVPAARKAGLGAQEAGLIDNSKVLIVGHTDDQEDSATAADLSERRARAVAAVFRGAGVPESSIYYQGAGETLPIADNRDSVGRARNRRVEIVDVANETVMASYLQSRVSTSSYFRAVGANAAAPAPALAGAAPAIERTAAAPKPGKKPLPGPAVRIAAAPVPAARNAAAPVAAARSAAAAVPVLAAMDFGGSQFDHLHHQVSFGDPVRSDGFSLFPVAVADDLPARSCVEDRARIARSVKSLRDAAEYKIGEYQPGAYGTSWTGKVNGHLVALNNVAVVRAGGLPAANPTVLIFKNYDEKGGASRKPEFSSVPAVNSYAGTKGVLYRVFFAKGAPLRCLDVVLPSKAPFRAEQGYVYQDKNEHTYATDFRPEVPSRKL